MTNHDTILMRIGHMCALTLLLALMAAAQPGRPAPQSDGSIQQAIQKRFAASKIGTNGFQVEVKNGIAILRGEAQVPQHKGVATRLAKLAGAREVDNQITISPSARQRREASGGPARTGTTRTGPTRTTQPPVASKPGTPPGDANGGDPSQAQPNAGKTSAAEEASSGEEGPTGGSALPRFQVKPAAGRGEARSQRRRY